VTVQDTATWTTVATIEPPEGAGQSYSLSELVDCIWEPGGRWFAQVSDGVTIRIIEAGTWRVLANLRGPVEQTVSRLCVTPDGAGLVVLRGRGCVEVWDLSRLQTELRALGAGFDLPPPVQPAAVPEALRGDFKTIALPPPRRR
jgi:WD40 repeat protein